MARRIPVDIKPEHQVSRSGKRGGGRPGGRGGRKAAAQKKQAKEKVRAKAEQLHENGMPFQMAMAVALGRMSLNDALERLARQEKVNQLISTHDLSRALATQIVLGHAKLDAVLSRRRLENHREENKDRSCLYDAMLTSDPISIGTFGGATLVGQVINVTPYHAELAIEGEDEPLEYHKLQFKYAWAPEDFRGVRKAVKIDKDIAQSPEEPMERPQDRYTCSDKRLFRYLDSETIVVATLLEGEVLKGSVQWFSRYEFGMMLKGDVQVTVFRHSLRNLTEA